VDGNARKNIYVDGNTHVQNGSSTLARMDVWPNTYLNVFPLTLTLTLKQ